MLKLTTNHKVQILWFFRSGTLSDPVGSPYQRFDVWVAARGVVRITVGCHHLLHNSRSWPEEVWTRLSLHLRLEERN